MAVSEPGAALPLQGAILPGPESVASLIGIITLGVKSTGKPSMGKPYAGFDEAGAGNGLTEYRASPRPYR